MSKCDSHQNDSKLTDLAAGSFQLLPFFSIITVCRNSKKTIRRTFDSMLTQACKDYEYIVVDGASTDGTIDIIKEYEPKFEGRMHWISEPDKGIYDAMNKGIRMAKGEIIGIVNSDDWYENNAIEIIAQTCLKEKAEVYYGMVKHHTDDHIISIVRTDHRMLLTETLQHPGCFIAKRAYEKFGHYNCKYKIASDYDLLLRIYLKGVVFLPVDNIVTNFYETGISSMNILFGEKEKAAVLYDSKQISFYKFLVLNLRGYVKYLFKRMMK